MSRFVEALAVISREQLLTEKWLVAPSLRVGHQWLEAVTRWHEQPVVNAHVKTLKSMALELAAPEMVAGELTLVSFRGTMLLVNSILQELRDQNRLKYLANVPTNPSLGETITRSVQAIRLAGLDATALPAGCFEVSQKGQDISAIATGLQQRLKQERLVDYADVLRMAIERLQRGAQLPDGDKLVIIPADLAGSALEQQLVQAMPKERVCRLPVDWIWGDEMEPPKPASNLNRLAWLLGPAQAPKAAKDDTVTILRSVGDVNEVRSVLRRCLANGTAWDEVELLHTDVETYVPLVYETVMLVDRAADESAEDIPVTFAEGIPCRYSRPGRALRMWLTWVQRDYPQPLLVQMIKEGLLLIPGGGAEHSGFSRLASLLRSIGIGFQRDRYLPLIEEHLKNLQQRLEDARTADLDDDDTKSERARMLERDVRDTDALRRLLRQLLEISPAKGDDVRSLILATKKFTTDVARSVNKLDRYAAAKLLDELNDVQYWLEREELQSGLDVWEWLEKLPSEARVLGSGPRPGCLHVDSVYSGGHSGRQHTFIIGLDDGRFPGAMAQDPLVLDREREQLSPHLPTAAERVHEKLVDLARLLARLRGHVTFSFSCRSLDSDDREMFPSPVLLSAFRVVTGRADGDQQDLQDWLPTPSSFAPGQQSDCADGSDWWLWRLTSPDSVEDPEQLVHTCFPHLGRGRLASSQRRDSAFTPFDGLVPEAGTFLDPTNPDGLVLSAGALELAGRCMRAFFFRHGLRVLPPDEVSIDPERWLDPLAFGSLLHELFEQFMRELIAQNRLPDAQRDVQRLNQLLRQQVDRYRQTYPPPNESALRRQLRQLEQTAHTFLREEERYCRDHQAVPVFLEASLGMFSRGGAATPLDSGEPIELPLASGKVIRLRGRIDRIDRIGDGSLHTYAIWDYKTGSAWGYDRADPFKQGRKIQPFLYLTMVAHCLRQSVSPAATVQQFGFFFPGVRAVGQRLRWTAKQLAAGQGIVELLCDAIGSGSFLATNRHQDDCGFCDYRDVCNDVAVVSECSQCMLEAPTNIVLEPIRQLRLQKKRSR